MKNLHLYLSLLLILTCAKEDSQAPNTPPSQIVKQYALTVSAGDGGSVTGGGTFASGTQVSLTATPNSGYSFSGWSNGSRTNPLTVTLNSNTSITANFEEVFYTLNKNEILISEIGVSSGTFAGMVYHQAISGSFTYNNNGNQYLFIPGMACSLQTQECDNINSKEEVDPKPGLHFKKTSEGWELLKIYEEVKTWGIRNFKVKDNFIAMGDGNEIGSNPWSGDTWFGEILGDEILWKKVNTAEEQSYYHGSTIGDLNNDGLMDIGGAPGRYVLGNVNYNESDEVADCGTSDGTNGGNEFYIFLQNQNGEFSSVDVINYPLGENGCKLFSNLEFTIEFENLDNDPYDEIIVSAYKDTWQYPREGEEWYKSNINNIIIYKYNAEIDKFELSWNSTTPNVFYPNYGENDHHGSTSIKVADFNNDGVKDISVAREYMDDLSFDIWLGNGDGTFEPYSYASTGLDLSWREFSIMDVDNDGDYDIVLKSNFGYFTKDQVTTDDGYNNWEWGITAPNEAGVNPNSLWKGVLLNELFWINDGSGNFSMYDEKPLYIDGIFPQQLIPYKQENKFFLLGFRNFGYDDQNRLKTEFYDLEIQF